MRHLAIRFDQEPCCHFCIKFSICIVLSHIKNREASICLVNLHFIRKQSVTTLSLWNKWPHLETGPFIFIQLEHDFKPCEQTPIHKTHGNISTKASKPFRQNQCAFNLLLLWLRTLSSQLKGRVFHWSRLLMTCIGRKAITSLFSFELLRM